MAIFGKFFEKPTIKREIPPEEEGEKILETSEIENIKPLGGGYKVFFVKLKDNGAAVFKPETQERCHFWYNRGYEVNTVCKRERAAYLVDRFLGFDLIPPTILRKINGEVGSLQQFIPDAQVGLTQNEKEMPECQKQLLKLWLLDYIIWNSDRANHNLLYKKGKLYAIDNELAFSKSLPPRFYGEFFDVAIPQEIRDKFEKFLSGDKGKQVLQKQLAALMDEKEAAACLTRVERFGKLLREKGRIPSGELTNLTFD